MRPPKKLWAIALLCCVVGGLQLDRLGAQGPDEADIAIIVNLNNPVKELTLSELRRIYRGERQYWSADVPVVLLIRTPPAREREVALRVIYQMNEGLYKYYWVAKVMRAEATAPPTEIYSNGMTKEGVSGIRGAIACIKATDVKSTVKVLRIDGHLPGEQGYPLR